MSQAELKLVVDENIELAEHFFAPLGEVHLAQGRHIDNALLKRVGAKVLLTRSVTEVNSALLAGTAVQFVGTATIGVNHVDTAYLAANHIGFASAAGCNAQAVAEYVITAIAALKPHALAAEGSFKLGVVGMGNVGKRLAALANRLGWQVHAFDPLLSYGDRQQLSAQVPALNWHSTLQGLLPQVDALSLHVPLTHPKQSAYSTHHMLAAAELAVLPAHAMLINTCRGGVVNEVALMADFATSKRQIVLDVYEREPTPSADLLACCALASPHVAGYSVEGKVQGSQRVAAALYSFLKRADTPANPTLPTLPALLGNTAALSGAALGAALLNALPTIYNIAQDHTALLASLAGQAQVTAADFDTLRKQYALRREWAGYGFV